MMVEETMRRRRCEVLEVGGDRALRCEQG